jgi:WD40 repeat protein
VETGELIHELQTPDAHVFDVAFNSDGTRIATCGHHGADYADHSQPSAVRLWNAETGKEVAALQHPEAVHSVAFSADDKRLATGAFGSDRHVRIWDAQTGAEVTPGTDGGSEQVLDVAFSPNGEVLASAGADGIIRLWDAGTGKLQRTLRGHTKFVRVVAFHPDGKRLASGAEDGTVRMWDLATGDGRVLLDKAGQQVTGVDFSRDGKTLAAAVSPLLVDDSAAGSVQLWDVGADAVPRVLPASGALWGVALSPDGRRVAAVGARTVVYWWDKDSGRALAQWDYGTVKLHVRCAAFDPSGRLVATSAHGEGDIRIWEVQTGHLLRRLPGHSPQCCAAPGEPTASCSLPLDIRMGPSYSGTDPTGSCAADPSSLANNFSTASRSALKDATLRRQIQTAPSTSCVWPNKARYSTCPPSRCCSARGTGKLSRARIARATGRIRTFRGQVSAGISHCDVVSMASFSIAALSLETVRPVFMDDLR